ncbi:MAG: PorT family protein [Haliscomenobacteraceae bacterium CHB4]|nr:hypothetical protein [Saprospiraceae bacterium]MCE7924343.1 PorT family protein [Haliscomenobacteraceae bacterium CHB4]
MNDKLFDKKIKAALDNLEAPYDASSWDILEQRLNAPFAEEHPAPVDVVDKAVFRTLERLEAPYHPAHWDILAQRMTWVARQRRRVWVAKLTEAAIFLLLLVNLDGLPDNDPAAPQKPIAPQTPANHRLQAQASERDEQPEPSLDSGAMTASSEFTGEENGVVVSPALLQNAALLFPEAISALNNSSEEAVAGTSGNLIESMAENWSSIADMMTLPLLPGAPVARVNADPRSASTVHIKAPKQHHFYAATFANFDRNNVRSKGYSNSANGHGGGMAIGYRIGKWGVEAGLSYNRRHYQPKKEVEIYDITANGLYGSYARSVDADIVSVPLKVTRRVAQFGQTTLHATAGVTTNVALDKSYQYQSVFYPAPSASGNPDPAQQPKLRKNGKGVLESGSFGGNVYASADVGVRVEQPIGRHIAAFAEPSYRLAMGKKGIGPNPAKVNTFSLQAGVLATL